jgi:16S rRNA (adenine1518-N6/adenine1519-N6)-dimethyltransferase
MSRPVNPKKRLGQHFLKDHNIAKKIVQSLKSDADTPILEIGPGTGILTKYIIETNKENFYCIDIDTESTDFLQSELNLNEDQIINQDYLRFDHSFFSNKLNLIGNLPYNISSQIFFKVLEHKDQINQGVFMIQKEVAERLTSKNGCKEYGILSVLLQLFYDVKILFNVSNKVFDPPPKVTSSVIRIERNTREALPVEFKLLKQVVKLSFNQRRKTIRNSLKSLILLPEENKYSKLRPEQLTIENFISLAHEVSVMIDK